MPVAYNAVIGYNAVQLYSDVPLDGTIIPEQINPGYYPLAMSGLVLTETAADISAGNKSLMTSNDALFAHNTDSSAHTVTVTSAFDRFGRLDDITLQVPAGGIAFIGPFRRQGWEAVDGYLHYYADSVLVKLAPVSFQER